MCTTIKETELLTQFFYPHSPYALLSASMHNQRQGVNWLVVQQENHLIRTDEIRGTSVKLWDSYLHEITSFVTGVLITVGRSLWVSLDRPPLSIGLLEAGKSRTTALELVEKVRYNFA